MALLFKHNFRNPPPLDCHDVAGLNDLCVKQSDAVSNFFFKS